jgi:YidC/Oxa1 family membrane protein insertase
LEIQDIPEKIGYLSELGLDYGWGPSSMMEWLIEHFHITTGLPWWGSIIAAGVLIRLALLKPSIDASDNGARVASIKDKIDPIRQRMMYHSRNRNQREQMVARADMKDIQTAAGVSTWKSMVPMLQVPFGFGMYRVVKGMTSLPVPGLAAEEFAWIRDLTIADPLFILPIATSVFMYFTLKVCETRLAYDTV